MGFEPLLITQGGSLAKETYSTDKAEGYCQFLYHRTLFLLNKLKVFSEKLLGNLVTSFNPIELQDNSHDLKIIQTPATRINPLQHHNALMQNNTASNTALTVKIGADEIIHFVSL